MTDASVLQAVVDAAAGGVELLQYASPEAWATGDWYDAIFQPITEVITEGLFGVIVGLSVLASFYIAGRADLAAPTVFVMIFSPVFIGVIPAQFNGMVWALALVGLVAAILQFARKYVLEPGMVP